MDIIIPREWDGALLRYVIAKHLGVTGTTLKRLKTLENGIMLDGQRVTVRAVAREGQTLTLGVEDTECPEKLTPVKLDVDIAYEDENVIIPSKTADMPTHQSFGHYDDTLANALAYIFAERGEPFVFRAISRLDKDTSGLLLIAKNRLSAAFYSRAMADKQIHKQYIAILDGVPTMHSGVIDTYIRRVGESIIERTVCEESDGADRAITRYTVLAENGRYSVVLATPVTGRTHQLRVHFAHIGCAIFGDGLYGKEDPYIKRHALHSYSLEIPAYSGIGSIRAVSPVPTDMARLIEHLFDTDTVSRLKSIMP